MSRNMSDERRARKREYDVAYAKQNIKQITLSFNEGDSHDMRIYGHIKGQKNQTKYVKGLVENDMGPGN